MMKRFLVAASAFCLLLLLTVYAADAAEGVRCGLALSAKTALPALFPFFVAGSFLTRTGAAFDLGRALAKPFRAVFHLPGAAAAALVTGLLGGYPVGAQTTVQLYRAGAMSRAEAERLIAFANCSGPAFLIGVCGIAICSSAKIGFLLYGIHVFSALLVGVLLPHPSSGCATPAQPAEAQPLTTAFVGAVTDAAAVALKVTAFIVFFSVLLSLSAALGLTALAARVLAPLLAALHLPESTAYGIAGGILELTNGLASLPRLPARALVPVMSALVGFGGLSVHGQTAALTAGTDLSLRPYFFGKILHAVIAYTLASFWCLCLPAPAFSGGAVYAVSLTAPFFLLLFVPFFIKKSGNQRSHPL